MYSLKYSFRKTVLIMYLVTLIGICTYVPWEAYTDQKPEKEPAGHTFIWVQPTYLYTYSDGAKILGHQPLNESAITANASLTSRLAIAGIDYGKIATKIVSVTALFGIVYIGGGAQRRRS